MTLVTAPFCSAICALDCLDLLHNSLNIHQEGIIAMSNYRADYRGPFGFIMRHPRLILAAALLLAALSIIYTTQKMEFLTGRADLMPKNTKFHADYRAYRQEFGDM